MCRLDDRDLRLERQKWVTQRQQALVRYREAMAEADPAKMNQFKEQMGQAEAQLALIEEELARVNILAPFRGVVVKGDLSQSLGAPVERGQVLFEVAPLDAYRVKLQVDDSDINYVKLGQKGDMVLTAVPDRQPALCRGKDHPGHHRQRGAQFLSGGSQVGAGLRAPAAGDGRLCQGDGRPRQAFLDLDP